MNLPVEIFLALRYLRPRRTFVSVITVLSVLGVTLGVMVLIVVLSVMTGFREQLEAKIIGFNSHLNITSGEVMSRSETEKILTLARKQPEVAAASPYIRGSVGVMHQGKISQVYIKSLPETGEDPVLPMKEYVTAGEYELRGDSVIIGHEWGRRNLAFVGDEVDLYGPSMIFQLMAHPGQPRSIPLPEAPIVRGIFQTGEYDYDQNYMLVPVPMAERLYGLTPGMVHGVAIKLKDLAQARAVKERLNRLLPSPFQARTWMDDNHDLFNALATEQVVMTFILFFVMVVAAFGLCSTLITITVQKSREIGLMKALGAPDRLVCLVFLWHGVVVGLLGGITGVGSGLLILFYRNLFRSFLLKHFGIETFPGSIYGLPAIPAVINPGQIALIAASALLICVGAALIPALGAARLAPARALRYE